MPAHSQRAEAPKALDCLETMVLYQETAARIDIDVIDRLCRFFKVQVGDLFEYVPENDRRKKT